jgi:hypothetical protein
MCGSTQQQTQIESEQQEEFEQEMQEQMQVYAEDQGILKQMQDIYSPILAKGPNQEGFSQDEENNLNATAVEGTAENYAQVAKAAGEGQAAEGGGDVDLPSGSQEELKAQIGAAAAGQESSEESQIKQADYAQGYSEWQTAAEGLSGVANDLNPVGYSGAATASGNAAANTANQIAEENNSWENAAIGAVGAIGGAVVDQNPGGIFGP